MLTGPERVEAKRWSSTVHGTRRWWGSAGNTQGRHRPDQFTAREALNRVPRRADQSILEILGVPHGALPWGGAAWPTVQIAPKPRRSLRAIDPRGDLTGRTRTWD